MPATLAFTNEAFRVDTSFRVAIAGNAHKRLYAGATRMLRRLGERTGLFLPQDFLVPGVSVESPSLVVSVRRPGKIELGEDESYTIEVSPAGVRIDAGTDLGALHGLETLLQLISADADGYYLPGVSIRDEPRFPWRGLMIDAARHFMPVDVIKRNLDGMAAVKMNVLHWHLCDDQGFRVETREFPRLHEVGSDGLYYTQSQIREVVAYAGERGIRVVPEFDVPGHATAMIAAYPELSSAPGTFTVERKWGVFFPVLNPANEHTYGFLDRLFGEMAGLFPDPYFHIGGDEVEHSGHRADHWDGNPEIQRFKAKRNMQDNSALQGHFNKRLLAIMTKHKKIMIGWDEILHEAMPTNVVIHSWRGKASMERAAKLGYRSILSNGYYIDLIHPTDSHYLNDPLPGDTPLSDDEKKNILGGEATMWAEYVSPETIDSRIWPRTAAIAERLWSPQSVTNVEDMYRRLERISIQLEEHGLTHEKNYAMMLRRLTGTNNVAPLKTLVDVLEPVKGYTRGRLKPHTSYSPLTRVVDAARPDAAVARWFRMGVQRCLAAQGDRDALAKELTGWLTLWKENHVQLTAIIARVPALREIASMSEDLSTAAGLGIAALEHITRGTRADASWDREAMTILERAKEPRGQTELMILPGIEALVAAACGRVANH
jgi:hexosaminidase